MNVINVLIIPTLEISSVYWDTENQLSHIEGVEVIRSGYTMVNVF